MFLKYVVKRGTSAIVIKFDIRVDAVTVGGYIINIDLIRRLLEKPYFEKISKTNSHSQKNKVRYIGKLKIDDFLAVMCRVEEDFDVQKVKRVERLI